MVRVPNETLRDWRTGIVPDAPAAFLRSMAGRHEGVLGPYEVDCALGALARYTLQLLERVEVLEAALQKAGAPAPQRAALGEDRLARVEGVPLKDVRLWTRLEMGEQATEAAPRAPLAPATQLPAGRLPRERGETARIADAIQAALLREPARWWTTKDLCASILASGTWEGTLDPVAVSMTCTARWSARGWQRRNHPAWPNRRQYSAPAAAGGGA